MLIVADSSALVALATCDALELLAALYDDVKVPLFWKKRFNSLVNFGQRLEFWPVT